MEWMADGSGVRLSRRSDRAQALRRARRLHPRHRDRRLAARGLVPRRKGARCLSYLLNSITTISPFWGLGPGNTYARPAFCAVVQRQIVHDGFCVGTSPNLGGHLRAHKGAAVVDPRDRIMGGALGDLLSRILCPQPFDL